MTTTRPLRRWQRDALAQYDATHPRDFLVSATPGAGKTTFALTLASSLLERKVISRVIVVVPTDHLRAQWADAAAALRLFLDPTMTNSQGPVRAGMIGYVTTYAQVAGHPRLHHGRAMNGRSLVILDEVHHAADGLTWGAAVGEAFGDVTRRLSLSGTPFRTNPDERIPFVDYETTAEGELLSLADYTYGYRHALGDGVVRPVVFAAYSGVSRWMNSAGDVLSSSLSNADTKKTEERAWRTALDPSGKWISHVVAAADQRLTDVRMSGSPDAGGLMLATDQETARAYAAVVKKVTGHTPVLVLSDDPRSSSKIEKFRDGSDRWLIAVRQVSEGVDITRLQVCVWACSYRTPLFFSQAIGRVVRARNPLETATVFLPAVRPLLALAAALEEERNHVVRIGGDGDKDEAFEIERVISEPGAPDFVALDSEAEFAHVLHGGRAHIAEDSRELTAEDEEFLGLPGLLSPEQTAALLASRDAKLRQAVPMTLFDQIEADAGDAASWRDLDGVRKEIAFMVRQLAGRTGRSHADIHVELRKVVPGPPPAAATWELLVARRDYLLGRVA